jgi:hypothetical protein
MGFVFDRIMTNGVWFKDRGHLENTLGKLFASGYDGGICVSVDALHGQNPVKLAEFMRAVTRISGRPDIVSIATVTGCRDDKTRAMLEQLARKLAARLVCINGKRAIRREGLFVKIDPIKLSAAGKAAALTARWDGRWFKEDFCRGPGNVYYVRPDGSVLPCCGYSTATPRMVIGNIKKDSAATLLKNARGNRFVCSVFGKGLAGIRQKLIKLGAGLPAKTGDHCFFCEYINTEVPEDVLDKALI